MSNVLIVSSISVDCDTHHWPLRVGTLRLFSSAGPLPLTPRWQRIAAACNNLLARIVAAAAVGEHHKHQKQSSPMRGLAGAIASTDADSITADGVLQVLQIFGQVRRAHIVRSCNSSSIAALPATASAPGSLYICFFFRSHVAIVCSQSATDHVVWTPASSALNASGCILQWG